MLFTTSTIHTTYPTTTPEPLLRRPYIHDHNYEINVDDAHTDDVHQQRRQLHHQPRRQLHYQVQHTRPLHIPCHNHLASTVTTSCYTRFRTTTSICIADTDHLDNDSTHLVSGSSFGAFLLLAPGLCPGEAFGLALLAMPPIGRTAHHQPLGHFICRRPGRFLGRLHYSLALLAMPPLGYHHDHDDLDDSNNV